MRQGMLSVRAVSAVSAGFLLLSVANAATSPIGATAGSFSVDANGGANYSIPIAVPPGTAGMVPQLALTYNRQVQSGILGTGWSISGLSIIQRCGRTIALDGVKGGVGYDANDRFCLDGQRLLAINGGAYGADGTEYRTERESFSKIISYRDAAFSGSGPQYFRVWTKSGQILEYGVTEDSRIEAQGKVTVRLWALNKVMDRANNYFTVSYFEANANGEYRPSRIDYTGNSNISLVPYNSIQFVYEDQNRPDFVLRYEGGSKIQSTRRLTKIQTYSDNGVVREYRLTHQATGAANISKLTSITECGSDGVCLSPTTFSWEQVSTTGLNQNSGYVPPVRLSNDAVGNLGRHFIDVNGDGLVDLVYHRVTGAGTVEKGAHVNTGSTWQSAAAYIPPIRLSNDALSDMGRRFIDVNGDGLVDLVYYRGTSVGGIEKGAYLSTGNGWVSAPEFTPPEKLSIDQIGDLGIQFLDLNSDGLVDVIYNRLVSETGAVRSGAYLNTGTGWAEWPAYVSPIRLSADGFSDMGRRFIDVNGDGLVDLVYYRGTAAGTIEKGAYLNTGSGWVSAPEFTPPEKLSIDQIGDLGIQFLDLNSDGLVDVIYNRFVTEIGVTRSGAYLNTGTGWAEWPAYLPPVRLSTDGISDMGRRFIDVNGDGLVDLVYYRVTSVGGIEKGAYLNTGNGWVNDNTFTPPVKISIDGAKSLGREFIDVDGDGDVDLIYKRLISELLKEESGAYLAVIPGHRLVGIDTPGPAHIGIYPTPITNKAVHAADSIPGYPYQNAQFPTYVVSRYTVSDGLGGEVGMSYTYAGAKSHLTGGGWLGFRSVTVTDERTGTQTTTEYSQDYEAGTHGLTLRSETRINGVLTNSVSNFWSTRTFVSGPQKLARLDGTLSQKFELDGSPIGCAQINTSYDDFGNATQVASKTDTNCSFANAFTKTTTATYNNDETNWRLGQMLRSQTMSEAPGQPSVTRTVAYEYSPTTGQLTSDIVEPDQPTFRVTSRYSYDSFGNRTATEVSGADFATRNSTTAFDSRGQFPLSSTNSLGHTETRVFDPKWGAMTSTTGPNGLTTSFEYDGFGRLVRKTAADGSTVATSLADCDASCPALARYRVITEATGVPPATAYVDMLGRTIRAKGQAFDGQSVYQDTEYDSLGRVTRSSAPYYGGTTPLWAIYSYDAAGRVTTVTAPDGSTVTTTYAGLQSGITNALNQTSSVRKNAADQAVETTDALGNKTFFTYDAVGNLVKVVDTAGNTVITASYDLRGRKIAMVDADSGPRAYAYNALGELLSETDAKGQVTSVAYDLLGRLKTRTNLEGTSTWTYDSQPKGIGKLATVTGPGYGETHIYDALGRETSVQTSINGTAYTVATSYDALGRPETVTYPTGFKTRNVYDTNSALIEVRDGTSNALYWQANSRNERGQLLRHSLGNGITTDLAYDPLTGALASVRAGNGGGVQSLDYGFDALGNLVSRTDNTQGYTETFAYDGLNRLTGVNGPSPKSYQYDAIGNITYKSDVGTYVYHPTKVHAVANTSGTLNASFTYDANGNMTDGAGRSISYTSFNKPAQITASGITTTFTYSPQFGRMVKSNINGETVYLGKLYERVSNGAGVTHRHYVASPAGLVAIVSQGAVNNVRYLHGDHLGSTSAITDEGGNVVERLSFDPFGARRQPDGQDATGPIASLTTRGYTGHEQDDESRLINMNAREYDPVLGRFLQPDVVADGFGGQGMNRYSYVHNNPLSATDPSGNLSLKNLLKYGPLAPLAVPLLMPPQTAQMIFNPLAVSPSALTTKAIENYIRVEYHEPYLLEHPKLIPVAKAVISTVICIFTCEFDYGATTSMFSGLYDARFTYLMGGDMTDAWHAFNRSYISTGLTSAVGAWVGGGNFTWYEAAAVKGVAGGVAAEIQGGDFWQGFAMGAGGSLASSAFSHMRAETDRLALSACEKTPGCTPVYDEWTGELRTDGGRFSVDEMGRPADSQSLIGKAGMGKEMVNGVAGAHRYNNIGFARAFVVAVSKAHDYGNSWGYNASGFWVSRNWLYDTLFDTYSFSTMIPAAAFTAAAHADWTQVYPYAIQ